MTYKVNSFEKFLKASLMVIDYYNNEDESSRQWD
jgi:hypothetical protein